MVKANRLEHAPQAMAQMQSQQEHGEDVPGRHIPDLESGDYIVINVLLNEVRAGVNDSGSEVEDVEDDEGQQDRAAPVHGARGVTGSDVLFFGILHRARLRLADGKLRGGPNVKDYCNQQNRARDPQRFRSPVQKLAICIQRFGPLKRLQVSRHVNDNKDEQDCARYGHHHLFSIGGIPKARRPGFAIRDRNSCHSVDCLPLTGEWRADSAA